VKLPHHLTVRKGHLHIAGQDCVTFAERYGTPLYVTSEDRVVEQFGSYKKSLDSRYPKVQVLFAAKANGNLALLHGSQAALMRRGETVTDLTAAMEKPAWQK
jgi:diaminopimelate decarboxylase